MDHAVPPAPAPVPMPFILHAPDRVRAPVVFASAHSGRNYPDAFVAAARLDLAGLRRSEDGFVDELFADAPAQGAPLLCATFPRAYCDPNREPWELDPSMFDGSLPPWVNTTSPRVTAGLGTIARVVASGEAIYRGKLSFGDAQSRVQACWEPYHRALAGLLGAARVEFGRVLLVDCHSMPTAGSGGPDVVLGDAHGTACAARVTRLVEQSLTGMGLAVRRNDPYAGGYVTRHYGRPRDGVHALQVEVARRLYMDEARMEKRAGFAAVRDQMSALIGTLVADAGLSMGGET